MSYRSDRLRREARSRARPSSKRAGRAIQHLDMRPRDWTAIMRELHETTRRTADWEEALAGLIVALLLNVRNGRFCGYTAFYLRISMDRNSH